MREKSGKKREKEQEGEARSEMSQSATSEEWQGRTDEVAASAMCRLTERKKMGKRRGKEESQKAKGEGQRRSRKWKRELKADPSRLNCCALWVLGSLLGRGSGDLLEKERRGRTCSTPRAENPW
jgi:hypothetical protein